MARLLPRLQSLSATAALVVGLGACESTVVGPTETSPPVGAVSFTADIGPLLASSCGGSGCHVGQATSGVDLSTHTSLVASVGQLYGEAVVMPGDASGSALVDKIEASPRIGSRMPLGRAALTTEQIGTIRAWIDAGALNN